MNRLCIVGLVLFCASVAVAQQNSYIKPETNEMDFRYVLKANLLSPFTGTATFHFEVSQNPNSSSQFEVFYFGGQFFGEPLGVKGVGATYNYRYYIVGTFPVGVYVQPYVRYQTYWDMTQMSGIPPITTNTGDDRVNVYGGGLVFGYQWVFAKRLALDFFLGPSYNRTYQNGAPVTSADIGPPFSGGFIRAGCAIGFVF